MTPEDELEISKEELPQTLPILSLRNTVLFPGVVIPITAPRDKSIRLIKDANNFNKLIGVVAQKDESVEDPKLKDIYNIGTVAKIIKVLQMPDGNTTVIIQGKKRFEIERVISETPYITSNIKDNPEENPGKENSEFNAIIDSIKDLSLEIIKRNPNIPSEASFAIKNIESNSFLINFVASNLNLQIFEKQELLEIGDARSKLEKLNTYIEKETSLISVEKKIRGRVKNQMEKIFSITQNKRIKVLSLDRLDIIEN